MERANNLTVLKERKNGLYGVKNIERQINAKPFQLFTKLNLVEYFLSINTLIYSVLYGLFKLIVDYVLYPKNVRFDHMYIYIYIYIYTYMWAMRGCIVK